MSFSNLHSSKNSEKKYNSFPNKMRQHNCFNIDDNKKLATHQHIRMISDSSCDTEDWHIFNIKKTLK